MGNRLSQFSQQTEIQIPTAPLKNREKDDTYYTLPRRKKENVGDVRRNSERPRPSTLDRRKSKSTTDSTSTLKRREKKEKKETKDEQDDEIVIRRKSNGEENPENRLTINKPSGKIMQRILSIAEETEKPKKKDLKKIEFENVDLTLQDNFTGRKLIKWFVDCYKSIETDEKHLSRKFAIETCANLLKIGAISSLEDENKFEKFDKKLMYKWTMSKKIFTSSPKTPVSRLTLSHFPKPESMFSEECANYKKSFTMEMDQIKSEKASSIKTKLELKEQSTQTNESSFIKKIASCSCPKAGSEGVEAKPEATGTDQNTETKETKIGVSKEKEIPEAPNAINVIPSAPVMSDVSVSIPIPPPPMSAGLIPQAPPSMNGPPMAQQGPRKPAVKPPKKMRILHWKRILLPNTSNIEKGKFWLHVLETPLENLEKFIELFSIEKKTSSKDEKKTEKEKKPKNECIKILDGKKSQNVGIAIRKLDMEEVKYVLLNCKTVTSISVDELLIIEQMQATSDELKQLKEVKEVERLDAPEAWLLQLSEISFLSERISCIVTQTEFESNMFQLTHRLSLINSLSTFFIESESLKRLISIILTLGNFLNGGNAQKGQADGFGLEILGKLKDVKANDPKITLLHFIVKTYIEKHRKLHSIQDIVNPIPDPLDVEKASHIDFDEINQDINKISGDIEKCKKNLKKIVGKSKSSADEKDPFKEEMDAFISQAEKKLKERLEDLRASKIIFQKAVDCYGFVMKKSSDVKTPGQFFEQWSQFTADFSEIFKAEVTVIKDKLQKLKKTKTAETKQVHEGSLKSKMMRVISKNA